MITPKQEYFFDKYIHLEEKEANSTNFENKGAKREMNASASTKGHNNSSSNVMDIFSPVNKGLF